MQVISPEEAGSNFRGVLASVEAGEEFLIARGANVVAKLIRANATPSGPRPKVGEMISKPFSVPDSSMAPLTPGELKSWGL